VIRILKSVRRAAFETAFFAARALALALYPVRTARRLLFRHTRSLWSGTPILTMPIKCRAERMLGVDARTLVFSTYYITDAFDYDLSRLSAVPVLGRLLPLAVFVWACVMMDRLHFYCDRGIIPSGERIINFRELAVYRVLGIDVFCWTYGADVRSQAITRSLGSPNACTDCDAPGRYCICDDRAAADNMRRLAALTRAVFSMGDMAEYTPGSRNHLFFWPIDLDTQDGRRYEPAFPAADGQGNIRIAHAPNHRMFKGTRHLEQAIRELQAEGMPVELVLVEKVPNAEALEIYRSADIIFDQCLIGFHGYFALEGMALGKPVMCYIRKPEQYLLHPEECPIINTSPTTLKQDLRRLMTERKSLHETGRRGRAYIERHFSVPAFATRLGAAYRELGIAT
jgi:hypothetical protein